MPVRKTHGRRDRRAARAIAMAKRRAAALGAHYANRSRPLIERSRTSLIKSEQWQKSDLE